MSRVILLLLLLVFLGCKNNSNDSKKTKNDTPKMYQMSPMALLMEQMYVDNLRFKERIVSGDTLGEFPEYMLKIHSALLTDETDKDVFFVNHSEEFIQAERLVFKDSINVKEHFNNAVQSCISCHEVKCLGPIPRIKKLFIK